MPHFTRSRPCTGTARSYDAGEEEGTANNGNVHITCAQSPLNLLDIRQFGVTRLPDRRDAFTRHYTAIAGGLQQVMTEQGKSGFCRVERTIQWRWR